MVRPSREDISTFIAITGASEPAAVRKLEEHGGNLGEAVNAHFNEGDGAVTSESALPLHHTDDDAMDVDDPLDRITGSSFLSAQRISDYLNPFSLLDSVGRGFLSHNSGISGLAPCAAYPRVEREIPNFRDNHPSRGSSDLGHGSEDVYEHQSANGPVNRASAPPLPVIVDNNEVEEQIIQAVIEASKRENSERGNQQSSSNEIPPADDSELVRALSLSLETAEQERALREQELLLKHSSELSFDGGMEGTSGRSVGPGIMGGESSDQLLELEDLEEQPLVRHRFGRVVSRRSVPASMGSDFSASFGPTHNNLRSGFGNWTGIYSEEHEAAMFARIPQESADHLRDPQNFGSTFNPQVSHPPSTSLTEQRLIREQQDDDYLAALQADKEKELKVLQEAEQRRVEDAAAREIDRKIQKFEDEENYRKELDAEVLESKLAAKRASLPEEPSAEDENSVAVLVRMHDGSRHGRRFLKSDKLLVIYDFLDCGRFVKPGTYRLVRPYPRRAFSDEEKEHTLGDLGLTGKQEALYLEMI